MTTADGQRTPHRRAVGRAPTHRDTDQPDGGRPGPGAVAIATDALTKVYGARTAVRQLSITVRGGEVYGLLGPNGAGKSTTLRMLLGLVTPTSGSAAVCGAAPGSPEALAQVGALVEEPGFYPYLSGRNNLRVLARYGRVADARVDAVLDRVGLAPRADDKVKTYSLGMRQRLGVAAALLKDPAVLILDEPSNGLDPRGVAQMRQLIRALHDQGHTVVLSSHLLGEVEQVCDRVGVLSDGAIVAEDHVSRLRGVAAVHIVAEPLERALAVIEGGGLARQVTVEGDVLVAIAPPDVMGALNTALVDAGVMVSRLECAQRSLEDVFLDVTGPGTAEDGDGR